MKPVAVDDAQPGRTPNVFLQRFDVLLTRFFDLSLDLLCIAGFDGYFKTLNPAWTEVLGFSEEELLSRPYMDFVHPDDRLSTTDAAAGLTTGERVLRFVNRYVAADGSFRWLAWTSMPAVEEQLVYAIARDVSEQQHVSQLERARSAVTRAVSASDDWHAGIERILEAMVSELGWTVGALWESVDGDLRRTAVWSPSGLSSGAAADADLPGRVLAVAGPVMVDDLQSDGGLQPASGLRGAVAFPVVHGREVRAVLCFFSPNVRPLEPACLELLADIGLQLGEFGQRLAAEQSRRTANELHQAALEYRATHDPLTGLPNRELMADRVGAALRTARRVRGRLAVMVLDLDGFKALNDANGHAFGDDVLKQVAARLTATVRESDTVARIGGDEFALLALGDIDRDSAGALAAKVRDAFTTPLPGLAHTAVGVSVGVALFPDHGDDSDVLFSHADAAMYSAKESRAGYATYAPGMPPGRAKPRG